MQQINICVKLKINWELTLIKFKLVMLTESHLVIALYKLLKD